MVRQTNRRLESCQGKERFGSFRRARRVGRMVASRRHEAVSPYPCAFCGGFHLGTHIGPHNDSVAKGGPDQRQNYAVFASHGNGPSTLVGFSNASDGGRIVELITQEGWRVTRIIPRKRGPR